MLSYNIKTPVENTDTQILFFVKEAETWFLDFPEFLNAGLGTRSNLMMVDGADTFLDLLCEGQSRVTLHISIKPFIGWQTKLQKIGLGLNSQLLNSIGHAPVEYGAYYQVTELQRKPYNHQLWLCPVTEYIFGEYPEQIFLSVIGTNYSLK
jgi:hypothetical protein